VGALPGLDTAEKDVNIAMYWRENPSYYVRIIRALQTPWIIKAVLRHPNMTSWPPQWTRVR